MVGGDTPCVAYNPISFDLAQITSKQNGTKVEPGLPVSTLAKGSQMHCAYPIHTQATLYEGGGINRNNDGKGNGLGIGNFNDPMFTLTTIDKHIVAHTFSTPAIGIIKEDTTSSCITKNTGGGGETQNSAFVLQSMAVRRLTPIECERLQGFPDNYTNIKDNCPDGPRYKALGNSMAVPVMKWIGERINDKS
jgi:DNA (cytosine-5)-methyltransferase 1